MPSSTLPSLFVIAPCLLALALASACGGQVLTPDGDAGSGDAGSGAAAAAPLALYVAASGGCPEERPVETATEELTPLDSGNEVTVVELFHMNECTGLGGQYILARTVDGFGDFWLGGHGCQFFAEPAPASPVFGVLRYNITAALFQLPGELCLGFPGEAPGAETSLITKAVAVFATLEGAQAFAATLPAAQPL